MFPMLPPPALASAPSAVRPVDGLVAAERAFAARAQVEGVQAAFVASFAEDALVFRPGPVPAQSYFKLHPWGPVRLDWGPSVAEVSAAGDLGWTSGPWELGEPGKPPVDFGHFLSIWRRQPDGAWKVVLDTGVSHPKDGPEPLAARGPEAPAPGPSPVPGDLDRDSAPADLAARATADFRLYRSGVPPVLGTPARRALAEGPEKDWTPLGRFVARSGDLACTYGRVLTRAAGAEIGTHYVRIWRREAGSWRLAAQMVMAPPRAQPPQAS